MNYTSMAKLDVQKRHETVWKYSYKLFRICYSFKTLWEIPGIAPNLGNSPGNYFLKFCLSRMLRSTSFTILLFFLVLQQVEWMGGLRGQNRRCEQSMMMKHGQMGAMPLNWRKKVKWRLQRWICPPFWCLILFGQKIPTDRLGGCWETHMLDIQTRKT